MKKTLIILSLSVLTIVIAGIVLFSCQKSDHVSPDKLSNVKSGNSGRGTSNQAANGNSLADAPTCSCPAPSVQCSTSCLFSDCCVCCTQGLSCGAGCYFGVAKCACNEPEKKGAAINASVKFKIDNFEKLKTYLQNDLKVWSSSFDSEYRSLLSRPHVSLKNYSYSVGNSGVALEYNFSEFSGFQSSYKEFIESLTIDQQESILKFISTL
jgi:hypothetical protein